MGESGWLDDPAWRESRRELDSESLKGLAHPLRMQLLGLLRREGPSTATKLAAEVGESSGTTSYHLRQLERHGFVGEQAGRGTGRERWWRALHRSSTWTSSDHDGDGADAAETRRAELFLRQAQMDFEAQAYRQWEQVEYPTASPRWRRAGGSSDYQLRLTTVQTQALTEELSEVVDRHRAAAEAASTPDPDGVRQVALFVRVVPQRLLSPEEGALPGGPSAVSGSVESAATDGAGRGPDDNGPSNTPAPTSRR